MKAEEVVSGPLRPKHLPSPTNPRIKLHQEYVMRARGYDEVARVESVRHGWKIDGQPTTCIECLEVAHA